MLQFVLSKYVLFVIHDFVFVIFTMAELCTTCLSPDRTLEPIDLLSYGLLFGDKVSLKLASVCWECAAMFRKLLKFRSQVLFAQTCLDNLHQQSLSVLNISNLKIYDICCGDTTLSVSPLVKPDPETQIDLIEITIKEENENVDYDNEEDDLLTDIPKIKQEKKESNVAHKNVTAKKVKKNIVKKPIKHIKNNPKKKVTTESKLPNLTENNYFYIEMSNEEVEQRREEERMSQKYREVYKFRCDLCIVGFFSEERYQQHLDSRHSEKIGPYQCSVCKARFANKSSHLKHCNDHFRKYQCRKCGLNAYKLSEIKYHDATQHDNMKFKCTSCDIPFSTRSGLRFHNDKVHADPIECDICGKRYRTLNTLQIHKRTIHKSVAPATCHICRATCRNLARHVQRHHGAPRSAAYCAECDKRFVSVYIYRSHLKFSAAHRPVEALKHKCSQCEAKFVSPFTLKKHIQSIHKKEWAHKCDRCDRGFQAASNLRKHVLHDHEGVEKPRNKICHLCGRGFTTKNVLNNHLRTHTGERPFQCQLCPAAFTQKGTLATHVRGVHKKKIKDKDQTTEISDISHSAI